MKATCQESGRGWNVTGRWYSPRAVESAGAMLEIARSAITMEARDASRKTNPARQASGRTMKDVGAPMLFSLRASFRGVVAARLALPSSTIILDNAD